MTRDEIIKLAQKAGTYTMPRGIGEYDKSLERFAALVAAAEREACAKVCEDREQYLMPIPCPDGIPGCCVAHVIPAWRPKSGPDCAAAIRARSKE